DVADKEMAGQAEAVGNVDRIGRSGLAAFEKFRKLEQAIAIWLARRTRHSAAGAGRNIDQVFPRAGGGALAEIESETKFVKKPKFPTHEESRPDQLFVERIQHQARRFIEA